MISYRLVGQEFHFPGPVPEAVPFEISKNEGGTAEEAVAFDPYFVSLNKIDCAH